jgi:chemotaxis response regulator CheB
MPENVRLDMINGVLYLSPRPEEEKINRAIDYFFLSLADDAGDKAIGIIMSGTGTDGVDGCFAVESNGGVIIVQDPSTAHFDGMPMSSIRYDHPDYILSLSDMPPLLQLIVSGKEDKSGRRKRSLLDFY